MIPTRIPPFENPIPFLFTEFLEKSHCQPKEVIYVGDRFDIKDIAPAKEVGIISIAIDRGTKYDFIKQNKRLI